MIKLGRNYQLFIEDVNGKLVTITLPFTIEFDLTRNSLNSANLGKVRIYNLGPETRKALQFNAYDTSDQKYRSFVLYAGYGNNLPIVFTGNVQVASSTREGQTYVTEIECYDGGFAVANGDVNITFAPGEPYVSVIARLIKSLPNITIGAIGAFDGFLTRGWSAQGSALAILYELTGGAFFIDKGKGYALKTSEYVARPGSMTVINAATGLLNTPTIEATRARFEMIFEPQLDVGALVSVETSTSSVFSPSATSLLKGGKTDPGLDRQYKIQSVQHRGIISPAVSGTVITTAEFDYYKKLVPVAPLFGL